MGSIVPATTKTHGPFKRVVEIAERRETFKTFGKPREQRLVFEVLECGHHGKTLTTDLHASTPPWIVTMIWEAKEKLEAGKKTRRRCYSCRVPTCDWCGKEGTEDSPLSGRLPIYGANDGVHASCLAAYEKQRAEEEAWTARVREENLARRRANGEDV